MRWIVVVAFAATAAGLSARYAVPNDDEGWTLVAARAVWDGRLPYHDFLYTQMPLGPYVLGIPQELGLSPLGGGRALTGVFWLLMVVAAAWTARRLSGWPAAFGTLVLLLLTTDVARESVLVRGQSLGVCLLTIALAALVVRTRRGDTLGAALATAAAITRLSYAGPALVVLVYVLSRNSRRGNLSILVACAGLVVPWAIMAVSAGAAFMFGLFGFHQLPATDLVGRLLGTALRPLQLMTDAPWLALLLAAWVASHRGVDDGRVRSWSRLLAACWVALFLVHAAGGAWHSTYMFALVPSTVAVVSCLVAPAIARGWRPAGPPTTATAAVACVVALVSLLTWSTFSLWSGVSRRPDHIRQAQDIASVLRRKVPGSGEIFALSASVVAVESNRDLGASPVMGRFAYLDLDRSLAKRVKATTVEQLVAVLSRRSPTALVLTEQDLFVLQHMGTFSDQSTDAVATTVCREYVPVRTFRRFSEDGKYLSLWLRRTTTARRGVQSVGNTPAANSWMTTCRLVTT